MNLPLKQFLKRLIKDDLVFFKIFEIVKIPIYPEGKKKLELLTKSFFSFLYFRIQ